MTRIKPDTLNGVAHAPSYYAATAHPSPVRPPLQGQHRADVVVVGGGFAGLSAALELAERGYRVVVLESHVVGWGASGRNGGQMLNGLAPGIGKMERVAGADAARALWDLTVEATGLVKARIERHAIACDWRPGYFCGAVKPSHFDHLRADADHLATHYGYHGQDVVSGPDVARHVQSARFVGGVYDHGCGHLHPLNYAIGLAAAAAAAGAVIYEGSAAIDIIPGAQPTVRTAKGGVVCDHVVLAANAFVGALAPKPAHSIMPVATFIITTEPLGADTVSRLMPSDACVCDSNFVVDYFRRTADDRILFGGGVSYRGHTPANLTPRLRRGLLRTFPELASARIDYAWGGLVDITMNRLPDFGRLAPNIYYVQGFSGHGVALTGIAGKLIAETVAGTAERFDVVARLPHVPFPGGALMRMPLLVLAMAWYRLRDVLS